MKRTQLFTREARWISTFTTDMKDGSRKAFKDRWLSGEEVTRLLLSKERLHIKVYKLNFVGMQGKTEVDPLEEVNAKVRKMWNH